MPETESEAGPAARRWAEQLAAWAIPEEILAAAPESPWDFPVAIFGADVPDVDSPSRRRALEVLREGGTVLDVGAGGGAAGLPLAPPAGRVMAVDQSAELLAAFAARAAERGVSHAKVQGRWPDVAPSVRPADVVVCHHVLYNVPDLVPFVTALTEHARRRVVVEITAVHPVVRLNPLWRHFHGLDRPEGPTADDAAAVLVEAGIDFGSERTERPPRRIVDRAAWVSFTRRRLCLPADREAEVAELLGDQPDVPPGDFVTFWWDGSAR
ncbi:MAG: methyltransferase domain-containing protein [Actinomycetota bacterium]|nr:methyltransferase domain-containing protein [Actinomycetota bacterium]